MVTVMFVYLKECAILMMAHWINKDEINAMKILGLLCCLAGIAVHVYMKATKGQKVAYLHM